MPATVIDYQDTNAPAMTGLAAENAMYEVLKWALPQLGWTIEFDNTTDKIVFANDVGVGSGSYLRVLDGINQYTEVTMYSSMTDIDTGSNKTLTSNTSRWSKSNTSDSTERPWRIYGDKNRFYLSIGVDSLARYMTYFAGDIVSRAPLEWPTMLWAEYSTSGSMYSAILRSANAGGTISNTSQEFILADDNTSKGSLSKGWGANITGGTSSYIGAEGNWVDSISGNSYVSYAWMTDTSYVRGRMPGLLFPHGNFRGEVGSQFQTFSSINTPEGIRDCIALMSNAARSSNVVAFAFLLDPNSEDWTGVD